jgi:hypothetical protein
LEEISRDAKRGRVSAMRALVWAYLQEYHADEIKTLDDAGRWMERAGGLGAVAQRVAEAHGINQPPAGADTGGATARPRKARAAGGVSTLRPVEPA